MRSGNSSHGGHINQCRICCWEASNPAKLMRVLRWKENRDRERQVTQVNEKAKRSRKWEAKHPEHKKNWSKQQSAGLSDGYIALALGLPLRLIPTELIGLKRAQLEHKRLIKNLLIEIKQRMEIENVASN